MEDHNEVLCRMRLDLDGILEVGAVEKLTGKSKQITIGNALQAKTPEEIAAGRKRIHELFESRAEGDAPHAIDPQVIDAHFIDTHDTDNPRVYRPARYRPARY